MTRVARIKHEDMATDILVIGAGAAGLRASIEAERNGVDVVVVSKLPPNFPTSSSVAAGWIMCVEEGSKDEVFRSIVEEGCYLNNQSLVEAFIDRSQFEISGLRNLGVKLEIHKNPWKRRFGGPAKIYLCVADKGPRGVGLIEPFKALAEDLGAKILYNLVVTRLLTYNGSVIGATAVNLSSGSLLTIRAKAVILAAGGGAGIYGRTDNPSGTTGDGYAIAYRAGAELVDMEFIEFRVPNENLERIFKTELSRETSERVLSHGECHHFLGGVKVDENLRSSLKGLYAAGEVTGGLFGASRLGGSALADAIVSGARAGLNAAMWAKMVENDAPEPSLDQIEEELGRLDEFLKCRNAPATVRCKISEVMWRACGVVKNSNTMTEAYEELKRLEEKASRIGASGTAGLREAFEALNMLEVARVIVKAASIRKESRGAHWRTDYKEPNNEDWLVNLVVSLVKGESRVEVKPVTMTKLKMPQGWVPRIGNHTSGYLSLPFIIPHQNGRLFHSKVTTVWRWIGKTLSRRE